MKKHGRGHGAVFPVQLTALPSHRAAKPCDFGRKDNQAVVAGWSIMPGLPTQEE